jgi:hypothetical protein
MVFKAKKCLRNRDDHKKFLDYFDYYIKEILLEKDEDLEEYLKEFIDLE